MNFAMIGCGNVGASNAKCFDILPEERLTAVFDTDEKRAVDVAKKYGAKVYTDYAALLRDPEVEAVCICTPSHLHGDQVLMAIEAGKAVACEKPLEVDMSKVEAIIEASERTGVKVQCFHQRRLFPMVHAARAAVERGYLGRICLAEARLKYYRDQNYFDMAPWRGVSGGVLINQGIHGIDLLLWMLGERVKKVYAVTDTLAHKAQVEDVAAAVLTLEGGGLVTITATTDAYPEYPTEFAIHGTRGSVCFCLGGEAKWSFIDKNSVPAGPEDMEEYRAAKAIEAEPYKNNMHAFLIHDLAEAVRQDRDPMIPPREAVAALKVILALHESAKTGKAVEI